MTILIIPVLFIIFFLIFLLSIYIDETKKEYFHTLSKIKDRLNIAIVDQQTYNDEKIKIAQTIHSLPKISFLKKLILNKELNKHASDVLKEKLLSTLK